MWSRIEKLLEVSTTKTGSNIMANTTTNTNATTTSTNRRRMKTRRREMGLKNSIVILCLSFLLILDIGGGEEWGAEECVNPLGMESGKIPSSQITASSSFDVKSVGPQNARIRQEQNGGAWCPKIPIQHGVKEYLEVDFAGDYRITQTETQGRFGNGRGLEYTEGFQLEYWRESLSRWVPYKDSFGRTILEGNTNTYIGVKQQLIPPIIASRIRFIPHSVHPRTICMRVEAYGCHFADGIVHYETPQGFYKKNPDVDFRDGFYDGREDDLGMLRGGHGLLTDTLVGPNDFMAPHKNKGNLWIGWDNQSTPIKIGFQFDTLRKFQLVSIHVNNFVSQGAQVFASLNIYFSMDGIKFSEYPISWIPKKDLKNETAILEQIPLKGRLAIFIRLEFSHSNHWLLLSEIAFRSDIFTGNVSDDIHSMNYHQDGPDGQFIQKNKSVTTSHNSAEHSTGAIIGLVAGSISVCLILSIVSVACFLMRRNRRNTKLVGVMGMTPKSMSIGLGLNGCPSSDQLSTSTTTMNKTSKKPSGSSTSSSTVTLTGNHNGSSFMTNSSSNMVTKKMGKIALSDMKPVSISGETDSDESLYHELVFGRATSAFVKNKNNSSKSNATASTNNNKTRNSNAAKNKKNSGLLFSGISGGRGGIGDNGQNNSGLSYSSLGIANSSVESSCTSTTKTESDSGYGSCSQQLVRKTGGIGGGNRKIKYQKVNHGGDFSDVMAARGIEDEMAYYHTHNQNLLSHFQPSSPSTPSLGLRSTKLPLGQSLGSIPLSSLTQTNGGVQYPPSPPPHTFRIPYLSQHPQISYSSPNSANSPSSNHLLTMGSKPSPNNNPSLNSNSGCGSGGIIFPSSTNTNTNCRPSQGFFNSPRITASTANSTANSNTNRRTISNNNNHQYHSTSINTISAALSLNNPHGNNGGILGNSGNNNLGNILGPGAIPTMGTNSFGVPLMKSSGLVIGSGTNSTAGTNASTNSVSDIACSNNQYHHLGNTASSRESDPLGESSYYAATDIFQVSNNSSVDKHFDRF